MRTARHQDLCVSPERVSASEIIAVETRHGLQFIDITSRVDEAVSRSRIKDGVVTVYSRHTTAAVRINENEPLLIKDFISLLQRLCPNDGRYNHDKLSERTGQMCDDESENGHAHCLHLLLSTSEHVPVSNGRLSLGRWQSIFLIELDKGRSREVIVHISGTL